MTPPGSGSEHGGLYPDPTPVSSVPSRSLPPPASGQLEQAALRQQALGPVVDILQGARGSGKRGPCLRLSGSRTRQLEQAAATREGEECEADGLADQPGVVRGKGLAVGVVTLLTSVRAFKHPGRHSVEAELGAV